MTWAVLQDHWHELVSSLNVWKRGRERAVHKPLLVLMLLARAQRGESNRVRFVEIEKPLDRALREFGPPAGTVHPEYPFWHLKTDGIWEVEDAEKLPPKKGGSSPAKTTLRKLDAVGRVPDNLWRDLLDHPDQIAGLARTVLAEYWPETLHEDIAVSLGLDLEGQGVAGRRKMRDPRFRDLVLRAYERRCAVCGYDGRLGDKLVGVEAAHVRWHTDGGPDRVENGLALCSLHHKMFDLGVIGLTGGLEVKVSRDFSGREAVGEMVLRYQGRGLVGPQAGEPVVGVEYLRWHDRNVFRGPARL